MMLSIEAIFCLMLATALPSPVNVILYFMFAYNLICVYIQYQAYSLLQTKAQQMMYGGGDALLGQPQPSGYLVNNPNRPNGPASWNGNGAVIEPRSENQQASGWSRFAPGQSSNNSGGRFPG